MVRQAHHDNPASYLDIADFIQTYGADVEENLHQLWRRIVFNISISNTDDHLRNHRFIVNRCRRVLSPAYDINRSVDKHGLALNMDVDNNALDVELAKSVGEYFRLSLPQMDTIIKEVSNAARHWQKLAERIGISKKEREMMEGCFLIWPL